MENITGWVSSGVIGLFVGVIFIAVTFSIAWFFLTLAERSESVDE